LRPSTLHLRHILLLSLLLMAVLPACAAIKQTPPSIGVITNGINNDGVKLTAPVAQEQDGGYQAGLMVQESGLSIKNVAEGNMEDDVQVAIRSLVEKDKVVAITGATSNEASVRAAALVNFFNTPMMIPSTYGESILPSNNLWAFRISPPSSSYAQYLFGSLLQLLPAVSSDGKTAIRSALRIAILYEQNTFGESAAVATAHAAMKQGMQIGKYTFFNATSADPDQLKALAADTVKQNVQLVYLVSSDPSMARTLVNLLKAAYGQSLPVIIGQAGGFATQDFIASPDAEGIYILRQQMDMKNCPADIHTIVEAQSYAAVYLIDQALQEVKATTLAIPGGFQLPTSLSAAPQADPIVGQREKVRDIIKNTNTNVPCIGLVAFDNTGQNKLLRFEVLQISNGQAQVISSDQLITKITEQFSAPAPSGGASG
jgi:ABC-type branched-subunit amino acid transport system substrate-binding protein